MSGTLSFVCLHTIDTLLDALFKVSTKLVGLPAQGALRNSKLARHAPVLDDFVTPVIDVIVKNQVPLLAGQKPETLHEAVVFVTVNFLLEGGNRHLLDHDLFPPAHLADDKTRHAVEVPRRLADVCVSNLSQPLHHAVHRLVREIFRVAEPFRHEYPDQTSADYFIFLPGCFAVCIKPGEQGFERFFVDGNGLLRERQRRT